MRQPATTLKTGSALSSYIPTLDGWRAIAILMVLACHARDGMFGPAGIWPIAPLNSLLVHGVLGVDVFFGISGFLITSKLLEEYRRNGSISLKEFYGRRFFRILPAAWTYLACMSLWALAGWITLAPEEVKSCLFFWRNYQEGFGWYTGQFWSLMIEEHYYFLWPAVLALLAPRRARPVAVVCALAIGLWRNWDAAQRFMGNLLPGSIPEHRTDTRLDSLLWGCVVAIGFPVLAKIFLRLKFGSFLPIVFLALLALSGVAKEAGIGGVLHSLLRPILIPLMIASTVVLPHGWIGRFLEVPILRFVGKISYSLYLWQQPFLITDTAAGGLKIWQHWPLAPLGLVACALLSYYVVEQPLIRFGANLRRRMLKKTEMALPARASSA
jgi:peptidoglycan/LPS O-acetylase OafA/YrhL